MNKRKNIPALDGRKIVKDERVYSKDWWKHLRQTIDEWSNLFVKFASALGLLLTVVYCFAIIQFFPSGLTVGDSFLFIAIALAFGGILLAFAAISYLSWYWILDLLSQAKKRWRVFLFTMLFAFLAITSVYCYSQDATLTWAAPGILLTMMIIWLWQSERLKNDFREDGWFYPFSAYCFLLFALLTIVLIFLKTHRLDSVLSVWTASLCSGLFGLIGIRLIARGPEKHSGRWPAGIGFLLAALMFPLIVPTAGSLFFEAPFSGFGLRQNGVTISLNPSNMERYRALRPEYSEYLKSCGDVKDSWTAVHGTNILWHGIGKRSLVEIPITPKLGEAKKYVRAEFDSDGLATSRSSVDIVCFEVPDVAFATQSNVLASADEARLFDALESSLSDSSQLVFMEIFGHADRRPRKEGNGILSTARANYVSLRLQQKFKIEPAKVTVRGRGVLQPKVVCSEKLTSLEIDECLAPNRRVEIRIFLQNSRAN